MLITDAHPHQQWMFKPRALELRRREGSGNCDQVLEFCRYPRFSQATWIRMA